MKESIVRRLINAGNKFPRRAKAVKYGLFAVAFVLAYLWYILWTKEILLHWWNALYGIVPDAFFFRCEEFIALNSHNNNWPPILGFLIIILVSALCNIKKELRLGEFLCMIVLFLACIGFLLPCLCRAKEYGKRVRCHSDLKFAGLELKAYVEEYGSFPEKFSVQGIPKDSSAPFVLIEDEPRTHAGDLRHRMWSDGTVDFYYPWQKKEGKK